MACLATFSMSSRDQSIHHALISTIVGRIRSRMLLKPLGTSWKSYGHERNDNRAAMLPVAKAMSASQQIQEQRTKD